MPRTVLIVDDERDANDTLAGMFHERGFGVIQRYSAAEGLDAARSHPPDLIMLDLMLPDLDGFSVCEELKKNRATNLIPIVMVTAMHDADNPIRGVRVGANGYLAKPFDAKLFDEVVDAALEWREEHAGKGTTGEIQFDIRSEMTYLQQINDWLSDLYAHTPLTERQIKDLRQAVLEMGGNAIEWGHRKNADLPLTITYRIHPDSVSLTIRDRGPGFDPKNLPHAARAEDPIGHLDLRNDLGIREGGFGIMLARGLVDEFRYNDVGNEVTLVKRFPNTTSKSEHNTKLDTPPNRSVEGDAKRSAGTERSFD